MKSRKHSSSENAARAEWSKLCKLLESQDTSKILHALNTKLSADGLCAVYAMSIELLQEAMRNNRTNLLSAFKEFYITAYKGITDPSIDTEEVVDKYGVVTETGDLTKQGSTDERCPECGSSLELHGSVKKCPKCGTKPFEVKDGEKTRK